MINYVLNGKIKIIILIIGLIKKILLYKISYFPKPYTRSKKKREINENFLIMQQNPPSTALVHQILL